jgi:cell wall-associated NlpC family hydrolase
VIHVGIILENNQIIHASGQIRIDTLLESGILNELKKEITHTLFAIKRV